ncbi:hypothetical protein HPHPA5_0914 [Helicobacter pylori Hp A-5]|nr:hypothetical protein HPHPA5_0914 [Helicobacter pylori Hp A-5]
MRAIRYFFHKNIILAFNDCCTILYVYSYNKGAFTQAIFNFKRDYATIRDIMLSIKGVFD